MPRTLTYNAKSFETVDSGVYPARLFKIEEVESTQFTDRDGNPSLQFKWYWQLLDDRGEPSNVELLGWTSQSFSPKSKLRQWAAALLGKTEFADGEEIDLDQIEGKDALLTVVAEPRTDGNGVRNKINAVSPLRKSAPRASGGANQAPPWNR